MLVKLSKMETGVADSAERESSAGAYITVGVHRVGGTPNDLLDRGSKAWPARALHPFGPVDMPASLRRFRVTSQGAHQVVAASADDAADRPAV